MHPNGTTTTTPPPPAADPAAGDLFIPLNDEWRAILADERWIEEQCQKGAFREYKRVFIAVVDKKVLGHGKRLEELTDEVARLAGVPRGRVVTRLILNTPLEW
jgi:hypothetical protein